MTLIKELTAPAPGEVAALAMQEMAAHRALNGSPFKRAATLEKRLKLFLWGVSGAGKTTQALQFPAPAVIDLEGGTSLYGSKFEFEVMSASTPEDVTDAIKWLASNKHEHRTLIIDPITIYWEMLQKKWSDIFLNRNKSGKGYRFEFYNMQQRDWAPLKAEFKHTIRSLIALDMNVIITAHEKSLYAEGDQAKVIGVAPDAERKMPHAFDVNIHLWRDEGGRYLGRCVKDRSNALPKGDFEVSYAVFEKAFGADVLGREARPLVYATDEQKAELRELFAKAGLGDDLIAQRLEVYGADSVDDLTAENAGIILEKLRRFKPKAKPQAAEPQPEPAQVAPAEVTETTTVSTATDNKEGNV